MIVFCMYLFTAVPQLHPGFVDSGGEEDLPDVNKPRDDGTHTTDTDDEGSNGEDNKHVGMTEKMQLEALEFLKENPFLWDKGDDQFKNKRRRVSYWIRLGKRFNLTGK